VTVSRPGGPAERSAERAAEAVMQLSPSGGKADVPIGRIQRQATNGKLSRVDAETVESDAASKIDAATRGGRPLSASTRSFFEPRFERSLGDVRVHTGQAADAAARSVDAAAFTRGTDIVFRQGQFDPDSHAGKRLLTHELTHVLQQDTASGTAGTRASRVVQRQPGPDMLGGGGTPKPKIDADIDGDMPVVQQPDPDTCWAATAAMMVMYRDSARYTISEAMGTIDGRWQTRFDNGHGLPSTEMSWFMNDAGLVAEPPSMNFTVERIAGLVEAHGPLWMNADVNPGQGTLPHARLIVKVTGDGTPSGTDVRFVDPSGGAVYKRTFEQFAAELEEEPETHAEGIQIIHWP
jgi:hypothetical protein